MSFHSTIKILQDHQVRFVVIGGVAATILGSSHVTNDLDICYDSAPDNIDRLVQVLQAIRSELRGAEPGLPFVLDARTFRDSPFLTLTTTEGDLDLLDRIPGVGGYAESYAASQRVTWSDLEFQILSLPALIAAKRATGRTKDRAQLVELEAIRSMEKDR
jgi:hypothetical protein